MRTLASLLLLRTPQQRASVPGDWPIFGLIIASLLLWIGLDRLAADPGSLFYPQAAPFLCWFLLGALLLGWALARRSLPHVPFRSALFVLARLAPIVILAGWLIHAALAPRWHWPAAALLCIYAAAVIARALVWISGRRQWRALATAGVLAVLFIGASAALGLDAAVWYVPDDEQVAQDEAADAPAADGPADPSSAEDAAASDAANIDAETLLFAQQRRLDAALAHVEPSTPEGPPAVFFLGFAGVGSQRVFAEEIKLAARVVGERFGSQDRTLLLLNDRRDRESLPIATVTNLRYALHGIASRMDRQRDVLFLALSSHGSAEPALAVENESLPLAMLTGGDVVGALRESGIRHRIIVISACHAGAFMPRLRDDYTIVIAASAADRTSFGCSDDRDMTYFGEAFYRDALPRAASLRDAFAVMRTSIAARESAEHFDPSRPQAFFGAVMDREIPIVMRPLTPPPHPR